MQFIISYFLLESIVGVLVWESIIISEEIFDCLLVIFGDSRRPGRDHGINSSSSSESLFKKKAYKSKIYAFFDYE